jgi:hypothetical protein
MPPRGRFALLAALTFSAAGCGSAGHSPASDAPSSPPACRAPEAAVLPHTAGSLSETDSGAYCLAAGQVLDVFLTAPMNTAPANTASPNTAPAIRWSRISTADTAVVGYGNSGVLTPPINVTAGVFRGLTRGVTTLSSTLPNGTVWRVTIVVH